MSGRLLALWELLRPHSCLAGSVLCLASLGLLDSRGGAAVWLAPAAVFLMTGAANALNDWFDVDFDRVNAPHRPIPSGRASGPAVLALSAALAAGAVLLCAAMGRGPLLLALWQAALVAAYDRWSKRLGAFKAPVFALYCASVPVLPALAAGRPNAFTWTITACSFCAMMTMEIMKDVEDMPGDMASGGRTIPLVLGARAARWWAALSAGLTWAVGLTPWFLGLTDLRAPALATIGLLVAMRPFVGICRRSAPYFLWGMVLGGVGLYWGRL